MRKTEKKVEFVKKKAIMLLLAAAVIGSLCACGAGSETAPPAETAATVEPATETTVEAAPDETAETEPTVMEGDLFLKASSVTFSLVGEQEDIYLGVIPRELVSWESDDPSVVSVENGVLTATGVGTTTVRASYADRSVSCTVGCLAETEEALLQLDTDILCAPKRLPPEVDLEEPCTYFDNSAIVGDSITFIMFQWESKSNCLGDMLFLARGGTSLNGIVHRFSNIYYKGTEANLEDAIQQSGVERVYFLLGSNDHVLPTVEKGGGILDEQERELLQQQGILLSDATFDPLSNELQNIYAALAQPTETLTVSWCAGDESGAKLLPSFVVERIRKLFPQVEIQREDGAYRCGLPAAALALAGQRPGGALWRYFEMHGQGGTLEKMAAARAMGRGRLSPGAVRSLYGSTLAMSASRLDQVKSCHFGYFMEYGLRARERTKADFQAPEVGTFIHYLLENVLREVEQQGKRPERPALAALVRQYTDEYVRTVIDGYGEKSARFRYLFSRLRETALVIVENVLDELEHSDFRPVAFELGFGGKNGQLPAVTVTAGDTTLSVTGKVDRVDGWLKNGKLYLRVVDYKTGKKAFDLADVRYGLGIQMLLYLFALQRYGGDYFGAAVEPAGVLYLPARDVVKKADRAIAPDKLAALLRGELRRTGMVLSDPEVLTAMEHNALESPCYLPIAVKKDGSVSGLAASVLADAAQMGKMGRYVDELLRKVARELGDGNIDADPCRRGPQESACDWCPFASACWFDEKRDKPHYLQKTTPEEFWQLVDEEVTRRG